MYSFHLSSTAALQWYLTRTGFTVLYKGFLILVEYLNFLCFVGIFVVMLVPVRALVLVVTSGSTDCEDSAVQYRAERLSMKNVARALSNVTVFSAMFFMDNEGRVCLSFISVFLCCHEPIFPM